MPRRQKSAINLGHIIGLAGGVAFLLTVAVIVLMLFLGNPTGGGSEKTVRRARVGANELRVAEYLDNANAMRGNSYRVAGRVEEQLRWSPDQGRLISVVVTGNGESSPIPVLVPQQFSHLNLEKGSRFTFVVEVRDNGVLVATSAKPG
jgi:hypothetical protein